jgi:hypothetical protein
VFTIALITCTARGIGTDQFITCGPQGIGNGIITTNGGITAITEFITNGGGTVKTELVQPIVAAAVADRAKAGKKRTRLQNPGT